MELPFIQIQTPKMGVTDGAKALGSSVAQMVVKDHGHDRKEVSDKVGSDSLAGWVSKNASMIPESTHA